MDISDSSSSTASHQVGGRYDNVLDAANVDLDELENDQWEEIIAHELDGLPVLRVIVTHMHPDHIGLAHWL